MTLRPSRRQVGRALEQAGFSVVEAGDGIEGLDRVNQHRVFDGDPGREHAER